MKQAAFWLKLTPLLLFLLLAIFLGRGLFLNPQELPSAQLGQPLPHFNIPALGSEHQYFNHSDLKGQIALLNVWASWCETCSQEQAFLLHLKNQGVLIFGINYKDKEEDALKWLSTWGNPYQKIGRDINGKLAIDLGVYGAPETYLIDQKGFIRYRYAGALNEDVWKREFLPRIDALTVRL